MNNNSHNTAQERETTMIEKITSYLEKVQSVIPHITKSDTIGLWGAGRYGIAVSQHLINQGFTVTCFIDSAKEKQGRDINGIPVVAPDSVQTTTCSVIFTATRSFIHNNKHVPFDTFYIMKHFEELTTIKNTMFEDELSKRTFESVLLSTVSGDLSYCQSTMVGDQYFSLPVFRNTSCDTFVDVGAYVGDTIEQFLWTNTGIFTKIFAIEPVPRNINAMKKRIARLTDEWALDSESIHILNYAIGSEGKELRFPEQQGPRSSATNQGDGVIVSSCTLDTILEGKKITFLKADIEGMELEMLHGAKNLIRENKPKIAICVYHNVFDLIEITHCIRELVPEYKMALRHHSATLAETVLYCWI